MPKGSIPSKDIIIKSNYATNSSIHWAETTGDIKRNKHKHANLGRLQFISPVHD